MRNQAAMKEKLSGAEALHDEQRAKIADMEEQLRDLTFHFEYTPGLTHGSPPHRAPCTRCAADPLSPCTMCGRRSQLKIMQGEGGSGDSELSGGAVIAPEPTSPRAKGKRKSKGSRG